MAAVSLTPSPLPIYQTGTLALSAGPASTPVTFTVTTPGGGQEVTNITTDASGAASVPYVASTVGGMSVAVTQTTVATLATLAAAVVGN